MKVLDIPDNKITDIEFSLLSTKIIHIDLREKTNQDFQCAKFKNVEIYSTYYNLHDYLDNQTLIDLKREANQGKFILDDHDF